jgi:hypothetical protein
MAPNGGEIRRWTAVKQQERSSNKKNPKTTKKNFDSLL